LPSNQIGDSWRNDAEVFTSQPENEHMYIIDMDTFRVKTSYCITLSDNFKVHLNNYISSLLTLLVVNRKGNLPIKTNYSNSKMQFLQKPEETCKPVI